MGKIAFLFSGQGAQTVGMGKDLYQFSQRAKDLYTLGESLRPGTIATCFEGEQSELTKTKNAQPCLFLTALAFANELKEAKIRAQAVAGFSLGEIPALAFSGVLSEEDAFKLVTLRANKMDELSGIHQGGMVAALKLDQETVEKVCQNNGMWAVNYNCPGQISCAGKVENLDAFCEAIKACGGRAVKLAVSGAFHTPFMAEVSSVLKNQLEQMNVNQPTTPIYSNATGELYPCEKQEIIEKISMQASSPVRWEKILLNMYADGFDTFIEVGAGSTLKGFVTRTLKDVKAYSVTDVESLKSVIEELAHV